MYTTDYLDILHEDFALKVHMKPKYDFREELHEKYKSKFIINPKLTRSLISFQANKSEPLYRWFKYKEGFSSKFVKYILEHFKDSDKKQVVLDPFSGIGTTITTAIQNGFDAIGIELLPPGILATEARLISHRIDLNTLKDCYRELEIINYKNTLIEKEYFFKHLTITKGAFPPETEIGIAVINKYIKNQIVDPDIKILIRFAVNSILEDISFTRKDGQYLRWDSRSPRKLKSKFNKGIISPFKERFLQKVNEMISDIEGFKFKPHKNQFQLITGSSLFELHKIANESVDLVITSPPYCNRYDYTRTYALELAFNGVDTNSIKNLRQTLLSATVENKSKFHELNDFYTSIGKESVFKILTENFRNTEALNEAISSLHYHRSILNNKNIPIMVANYFFEMNLIIAELARVLKPKGKIIMVNDNVRYNGDEISVDLILSEFGAKIGLKTDYIWMLERGKGNSSQQMGTHGRQELRKCVYLWSK
jgi:DNA modification methylase